MHLRSRAEKQRPISGFSSHRAAARGSWDVDVSHTSQTLASGKRHDPPGGTVLANLAMRIVRPSHNGTSGGDGDGGMPRFRDSRNSAPPTRWVAARSAAMTGRIFSTWDDTHSELWGHQPIRLEHQMHRFPAFSSDELARLIETYPRESYNLIKTGAKGSSKVWREGDIGGLSGRQVVDAISHGGLWLNMRDVDTVDSRFRELIERMFEEVGEKVPGFAVSNHQAGILVSSPDAQVYYHADLPGQWLIQIAG